MVVLEHHREELMNQESVVGPEEGLLHSAITQAVLGAFYDVYNQLGAGFLESVYEAAMEIDLREAGLEVRRQEGVQVFFRRHCVGRFVSDLVVANAIIVELKAVRAITPVHEAQLINLLRATTIEVGLILNFGPRPEFKRIVGSNQNKPFGRERARD
jgi:GxxExxY protein